MLFNAELNNNFCKAKRNYYINLQQEKKLLSVYILTTLPSQANVCNKNNKLIKYVCYLQTF